MDNDKIKEKLKLAAGIKKKHDGRGRPKKVDKEKAATPIVNSTPVIPTVHVCTLLVRITHS